MTVQLFPYQLEGARFLSIHNRACLFDEMGLGKTAQLIIAAEMVKAKRMLIICPAAANVALFIADVVSFMKAAGRRDVGKCAAEVFE